MSIFRKRINFERIQKKIESGPRVTTLLNHFEKIANGTTHKQKSYVVATQAFLDIDPEYSNFYSIYEKRLGVFNKHGIASMPYVMEECIRMAVTLNRYASYKKKSASNPLTFYGTSTADATLARTLAEYSQGKVVTLTDSPNPANETEFHRLLNHNYSFFHLGPFSDINARLLNRRGSRGLLYWLRCYLGEYNFPNVWSK